MDRRKVLIRIKTNGVHCVKYRNFTLFPSVEMFLKDTVSAEFPRFARNYAETMPLQKISTTEN